MFESFSVFKTYVLIIHIMDSSSSRSDENDDSMIPRFTGGEPFIIVDDDAPLLKTFKSDHEEDLSLRTKPGDGNCTANCFVGHFNEPFDRILDCLDTEFRENILFEKDFVELGEDQTKLQDFKYITEKIYNNIITDMFLNAFSRIYKTKIIVLYTETNNADTVIGDNCK